MSKSRALVSPTIDSPAFALNTYVRTLAAADLVNLRDVKIITPPSFRETLTLRSPSSLACERLVAAAIRDAVKRCVPPRPCERKVVEDGRWTWATAPEDVLRYVFRWLRALDELSDVAGRATLRSCILVCKAWNSVGTEQCWRNISVRGDQDSMASLVATVSRSARGQIVGQAHLGSYVRGAEFDLDNSVPEASFEFLVSTAVHLCPNLRCLYISHDTAALSLPSLAAIFESCPSLVLFFLNPASIHISYHGHAKREDLWKTDAAGRAIIEGVGRLRALCFHSSGRGDVHSAINRSAGPNLISWAGHASAVEHVAANCPELKFLEGGELADPDLAVLAAGCHHLVSVNLEDAEGKVTDDGVKAIIHHCPAIEELSLFNTGVTFATLNALKSHRPLTFLSFGGEGELFETTGTEIALCALLSARGALLTGLKVGEPRWHMGAELAIMLPIVTPKLQSLHLVGMNSTFYLAWLADRLPALLELGTDDSVDSDVLADSIPSRVSLCGSDYVSMDPDEALWRCLAGSTPP
ncbi:hypothetical protein BDK51DRAFT_40791 [Blyttiomyces helicus]|uniref:F-box domain-containing protein n=1 Tax=Blyttiomyces helicus TaxID=388810 RepID=A0A4P9W7U0_9FUNG|nr:hypothetical protein BDK51DRAFT_40791 [Blyttiomyces helicus]|eukprot:RKO88162.1 hypothetical protein BDK51DRAFT_40791 [Blyttiomyces helicus]